jgi:hypothetical protein
MLVLEVSVYTLFDVQTVESTKAGRPSRRNAILSSDDAGSVLYQAAEKWCEVRQKDQTSSSASRRYHDLAAAVLA